MSEYEKKLKEYRRKANIKGFRPGNVPIGMIKKSFRMSLRGQIIQNLINLEIDKFYQSSDLHFIGKIRVDKEQISKIDWEVTKDFDFDFEVGFAKKFELSFTKEQTFTFEKFKIEESDIDKQLKSLQKQLGKEISIDA